jgi:hypothetical protein
MGVNPFRPLSGERALFRKDILPLVETIRNSRYGVETLINLYYRREMKQVRYVPLRGLFHPMKLEMVGPKEAAGMYTREVYQIAQAVVRHYPLTLGAFGLDPRGTQLWLKRVPGQFPSARFSMWSYQAFHTARRTVSQLVEPLRPRADIGPLEKERTTRARSIEPKDQ